MKKTKIFIIIMIFLIILTGNILATETQSIKVSLKTNKSNYNIGEEILVNVVIDEIEGFSGLNTFSTRKVYDKEKVEYIGSEVINENWKVLGDAENVLIRKMEGEDLKKGKICTLKFKALKEGKSEIKIDNIDACNNEGDVYYEDGNVNSPSVEISIVKAKTNQKSYIGIILITVGILGIVTVGIHYTINKKKN